jgi:DNA-binding NarL/FixJ family response regulator
MPTLAILEDSFEVLSAMKMSIQLDTGNTWQLLHSSVTSADMILWLEYNHVDILIADIGLPDICGIEVIKFCRSKHPDTEIIVCTVFEDDEHLFNSLKAGANAYLLKKDINKYFTFALMQLIEHGSPMSPCIARRVIQEFAPAATLQDVSHKEIQPEGLFNTERHGVILGVLTGTEIEILELAARGFKSSEIADLRKISIHTVNAHTKLIYKKLQVNSKSEAIYEARLLNIIH